METADRELLLGLLTDSQQQLLEAAEGLSDGQARLRPAPDHWSVIECVEHVGLVEDAMFARFTTKLAPADATADRSREELILQAAANRRRKFSAPEHVQPTGRFHSLAAALNHFQESRGRSIEYIRRLELDPRAYTAQHPVVGPVSGQEFLLILALHPARHAEQIREIRQALGLPESST
jgi:DinB superfamily